MADGFEPSYEGKTEIILQGVADTNEAWSILSNNMTFYVGQFKEPSVDMRSHTQTVGEGIQMNAEWTSYRSRTVHSKKNGSKTIGKHAKYTVIAMDQPNSVTLLFKEKNNMGSNVVTAGKPAIEQRIVFSHEDQSDGTVKLITRFQSSGASAGCTSDTLPPGPTRLWSSRTSPTAPR